MDRSRKNYTPPTREQYIEALNKFDAAVCESYAVSQAQAGRYVSSQIGYCTKIYTRLCAAGALIMRAAPLSRWVESDFECWDFAAIAGHARSILDGYLLFEYLIEECASEDEERTKINLMHLNDCSRRIKMLETTGATKKERHYYEVERKKIIERLEGASFFSALPEKVRKSCLSGEKVMLNTREQLLNKLGYEKKEFDAIYNLLSQHIHVLPLSFYRIEANGRGTGIENEVDRGYLTMSLNFCEELLTTATEKTVKVFPDTAVLRKGIKSKFSPGPRSNCPSDGGNILCSQNLSQNLKRYALSEAIRKAMQSNLK